MSPVVVNLAKVLVVVVLYGFLWVVARAVRAHLAAPGGADREAAAPGEIVFTAPEELAGTLIAVTGPTLIGRSETAEVTIDDPFASDRHASFDRVGGRLVIEDLGSTNGTLVNGAPVRGRRVLERGDAIRIGQTIMEVR